ncbi:MAG: hypothetical protein U5N55_12065 [Cypionkella sp.]|nr:hypothetical protein [Cypionkella sp.]
MDNLAYQIADMGEKLWVMERRQTIRARIVVCLWLAAILMINAVVK